LAAIALERVTKIYEGGVVGVRDLDLAVADGEFLVLVGASGSGKSTVLRTVAGLERVTTGRIRIGSDDVTDVPPQQRDLAMVFQSYALYPHLTVRENLGFGLEMRRVDRKAIAQRVRDVARTLELEPLLERRPAALSGGQRQRVALGRAIIREPRAFLLDEPLSNLDAQLRVQTRAELVRLHRQLGTTMLYVTHDQVEAMTMGQRIALLHGGTLQQVAAPLTLYDRPANRIVAAAIGSPPMNFFRGSFTREDGRSVFRSPALHADLGAAPPAAGPSSEVDLGIRPEHLLPCDDTDADLRCTTTVVEALGAETLIHARCADGTALIARRTADPHVAPDQPLPLRLDRTRLHLFDARSGNRVALP
jgi:multiple sugar transport system ATP-binding protein